MLRRRKLSEVALAAAAMLPLLGCSGGSQHAADEIYFLVAANTRIPYWQAAAAGIRQAATQLGVRWEVVGPETYDPKAQQQAFHGLLSRNPKPSGILVSPADPALMQPEIDAAISQGIPVITIDSDAPASKRLLYIGTDNYAVGVMAAQVLVKQMEGKGSVVVFSMPGQRNLADRLRGYRDVLATHPQVKIAEVVDIKGDPAVAFDRTTAIVDQGKPPADAFACLEALACPEVAEVLDRKRVSGKTLVAMDTEELTLERIKGGVIAATVAQKPFTMAFVGVKTLDDLHHHMPASLDRKFAQDLFSPIPAFIDTGATLVDKSNVEEFIQARGAATPAGKK